MVQREVCHVTAAAGQSKLNGKLDTFSLIIFNINNMITAEYIACNIVHDRLENLVSIAPDLELKIRQSLIEFAKLHVKEALKQVHANFQLPEEDLDFTLNAYQLDNIT